MADGEADKEFPEIRAIGPLFRNTEVFLWDDPGTIISGSSTHNGYLSLEIAASSSFQTRKLNSCTTTEEESSTDHTITDCLCVEELALAQQMDALGLPLSFGTSKARNNVTATSKRKGTKSKSASHEKERNNPVPQIMVFSQMENLASSTSLHDSTNMSSCLYAMEGQGDAPYHDAKEHSRADLHFDESISISALGSRNETGKKPVLDEVSDANSGNLAKFELSPDTVSFELNAEVLGSLSLHGGSCSEEILEDACSRAQFRHDGDLLNKHDLNRCSDDSSIPCCNMYLKDVTQTLQRCSVSAESSLLCSLGDHHDNFICCERRDWRVMWDSFYERNYFFNVRTLESTWNPPLGLEKYAFSYSNLSRKETHVGASEKNAGNEHSRCSISVVVMASLPENGGGFHFTDERPDAEQPIEVSAKMEAGIDFASHYTTIGNGNSNVQLSLCPSNVTNDMKDEENDSKDLDELKEKQQGDMLGSDFGHDRSMPTINENRNAFSFPETYTSSSVGLDTGHEIVAINRKRRVRKSQSLRYWFQRYSLFLKFDNGIKMDEESWFSVTPEQIAKHHADRCGTGTIIDCFTGVGGNAIQFARRSNHVIAIDVDPQKIDYAHHNATIYEVSEKIDFIKGDFFKIAPSLKGDVVFLAPPWGGPDYAKMRPYDIRSLKPREGYYLFKIATMIAPKVVMFLPRNVNLEQLTELSRSTDPPWKLEVENNHLNGKLKSITAYFDKTTLD